MLEGHGLAERGRGSVARGARVGLEEEGLALHLRVPRNVTVVAQPQQVLPDQLALVRLGHGVARIPGAGVPDPEGLVVDGQQGVDRGVAVPGD